MKVTSEVMVPATAAVEAWKRREDPESAAQRAEADELHRALPPQLDEFGRDENAARRDRAAVRSKARSAALEPLARRLAEEPAAVLCDGPGLAAAAAGGPEAVGAGVGGAERHAYYARRMRELREVAASTLRDVAAEFSSVPAVLRRVQDFKARFPAQYARAYVSEALPALMSVYVRLQLLQWDPLYANGEDRGAAPPSVLNFEEHEWFRDLLEFSGDGAKPPLPASHAEGHKYPETRSAPAQMRWPGALLSLLNPFFPLGYLAAILVTSVRCTFVKLALHACETRLLENDVRQNHSIFCAVMMCGHHPPPGAQHK